MRRLAGGLAVGLVTAVVAVPAAIGHPLQAPGDPVKQRVPALPVQRALEPSLEPTPQVKCGPGSRPETGLQGRVSRADHASGRAAEGFACNAKLVGAYAKPNVVGTVGGFKVERYVDSSGRECAYYDTTLLAPTNIFDLEAGVNVIDMSDPAHPKLTTRLLTPAMLSPHESLVVSQQRGVLAAVLGNPLFYPGIVDIYDISEDCRYPKLKSVSATGILGHESGLAPDGKTFYSASPASQTLVAVDIRDMSSPQPLWIGPYDSHGLSISADGNRAYVAGVGSGLIILDVSQVQARIPDPKVREVARLQWGSMSIPQNAIPITIRNRPYLVEIDEFGSLNQVGAARIIDIADETRPHVVSNLRLEVHQPEHFDELKNDPGTLLPLQGYAAHYCNVPKRVDPGIAACSMILSGLRVFDIRDPRNPREIAYFNAPVKKRGILEASNWAMSSPAFNRKRGEIWYSDGFQGFYVVRTTNGVWPFPKCMGKTSTLPETSRGTAGPDVFAGTRRGDRIVAGAGDDLICGGGGNDRLVGGPGRDRIDCGPGRRDVAVAGPGDRVRRCERVKRVSA